MASLTVENAEGDNMQIKLSPPKMRELNLSNGDTVLIKRIKQTVCQVLSDKDCPDEIIRMSRGVRDNLRVHSGEDVNIEPCPKIEIGREIHLAPVNSFRDFKLDLCKEHLKRYFENSPPIHTNDTFLVHGAEHPIQFKVVETNPSPFCTVAATTDFKFSDPIKPNDQDVSLVQTMLNISRENKNIKDLNKRLMDMITDSKNRLNAQDEIINGLKNEINEQKGRLNAQDEIIKKQNEFIDKQNKVIEGLENRLNAQDEIIKKQNEFIEGLKNENNEQKGCLISIRNVLDAYLSTSASNA